MQNGYLENLKRAIKGKVFVYIDAANLERSVQDMWVNPKDILADFKKYSSDQLCWRIDYQKFHDFFNSIGDLKEIRFYSADFAKELPPASSYYFDLVDFRHELLKIELKQAKNPAK